MKDKQHEGSRTKSFRLNVEELGDVNLGGWRMLREKGSLTKALLIDYEAQEGLIMFPALMVRSGGWYGWRWLTYFKIIKTVGRGNFEVLVYILLVWKCMAPNP